MSVKRVSQNSFKNRTIAYIENGGGISTLINSVVYTDSNYNTLTANAAATTFGTFRILGTNLEPGANVMLANTAAGTFSNVTSNTTYVGSNEIRANVSVTAGNYSLYIFNPDGSAAIYYSGVTFEPYPQWTTTSYSSSAIVNVQLLTSSTAVEQPITYALVSGTLPTGTSLSANGLISGTVTQANSTQSYTFTVSATDIYNETTQSPITLTISLADQYFNQTTLLLNGETATNTYIKDSSNNNFALSPYGSATSNRFSPLWGNGYYGVNFNGAGGSQSALTVSTPAIGTGNFTLEFWVYYAATTTLDFIVTDQGATGFALDLDIATGKLYPYDRISGGAIIAITSINTTLPIGQWVHIAAVRTSTGSNGFTLYQNGVATGTAQYSGNITSTSMTIGSRYTVATSWYGFNGNVSNLRLLIGTALYTTNFTPPTSPLITIANTALLTCQSANFTDVGPNAYPITVNGTVKVVPNQPFANVPTTSTANTNGAGYYSSWFDGSTGYLTAPSNAAFNFGSGAFTIEFWAYISAFPSYNNSVNVFQMGNHTGGGNFLEVGFINSSGTTVFSYNLYNTAYKVQMTTNFSTLNAWTHFAVIFTGTTVYTSINGVLSAGTSYSGSDAPSGQTVLIGYELSSPLTYFSGFISNLRVLKGTALYTTNFTPSTTPLTAIANTSLLTLQNSTIVDNSTNAFALTPNGKVIVSQNQPFASPTSTSTAITPSVYGSSSFDGSSSYIALGGQSAFAFGTGNFTIECWFYATVVSSTQVIYSSQTNGSYVTAPDIYIYAGKFYVQVSSSNPINGSGPTTVLPNTWYHVALVKNGSTTTLYVNGTYEASFSDSNTYVIGANRPVIGIYGYNGTSYPFPGYITNLRVVKGTAVYTNNFLPPNQPLTAVANTSLLTLQYKNGINNNLFQDDSVNNFALTRTGTPTQGTFTPFSQTGWSNYFDGSSGGLNTPTNPTALNLSTNNFTIEAWIYLTATPSYGCVFGIESATYDGAVVAVNSSRQLSASFAVSPGSTYAYNYTGSVALNLNTWYHVAYVRNGNTFYTYVNGVQDSTTLSVSGLAVMYASINNGAIGIRPQGAYYFPGYISNLRVVNGTAVYTNSFTPPTSPLTAITNTVLLACQSNRYVDN